MKVFSKLLDLLFPPRCVGCDKTLAADAATPLCDACRVAWEAEKRAPCGRCQKPSAHCRCVPPTARASLDRACALAPYQEKTGPVTRKIVLYAKEHLTDSLRTFLCDELARMIGADCDATTVITYVPRNPVRVRRVGYDQAKELAQGVASTLDLPFVTTLCAKAQQGAQKERDRSARIAAAKEAYTVTGQMDEIRGKTVLLLDDVLTTGATAAACAAHLKEQGARRIYLVTLGKTPLS